MQPPLDPELALGGAMQVLFGPQTFGATQWLTDVQARP
jgi:hypothetical protein